jgi:hypothetical protein
MTCIPLYGTVFRAQVCVFVSLVCRVAIKGGRLPLPPTDGSPFVPAALNGALSYRSSSSAGGSSMSNTQALVVPAAIRELMEGCFAHQPNDRPDTTSAVCVIDTVLMELDSGRLVLQQPAGSNGRGGDAAGSPRSYHGNGGSVPPPASGRAADSGPLLGSEGGGSRMGVAASGGVASSARDSKGGGDRGDVGAAWPSANSGPGQRITGGAAASGGDERASSYGAGPPSGGPSVTPASGTGDGLLAVGNQPQLATPFSNLDFLLD